jgi:hypothetical protein
MFFKLDNAGCGIGWHIGAYPLDVPVGTPPAGRVGVEPSVVYQIPAPGVLVLIDIVCVPENEPPDGLSTGVATVCACPSTGPAQNKIAIDSKNFSIRRPPHAEPLQITGVRTLPPEVKVPKNVGDEASVTNAMVFLPLMDTEIPVWKLGARIGTLDFFMHLVNRGLSKQVSEGDWPEDRELMSVENCEDNNSCVRGEFISLSFCVNYQGTICSGGHRLRVECRLQTVFYIDNQQFIE